MTGVVIDPLVEQIAHRQAPHLGVLPVAVQIRGRQPRHQRDVRGTAPRELGEDLARLARRIPPRSGDRIRVPGPQVRLWFSKDGANAPAESTLLGLDEMAHDFQQAPRPRLRPPRQEIGGPDRECRLQHRQRAPQEGGGLRRRQGLARGRVCVLHRPSLLVSCQWPRCGHPHECRASYRLPPVTVDMVRRNRSETRRQGRRRRLTAQHEEDTKDTGPVRTPVGAGEVSGRREGAEVKSMASVVRMVVAGVAALSLTIALIGPAVAEDEPASRPSAEEIRELVLEQRAKVLAQIAAILAREDEDAKGAEIAEIEDGEPEDGEAEDGEPEDGEPEDGEPEDGEPEDEGVGGECEPESAEAATLPAADAGASTDGATEDAAAAGAEGEDGEPEGGESAAPAEDAAAAEDAVCALPDTGVGDSGTDGALPLLAALGALSAAGLSLRRRFS